MARFRDLRSHDEDGFTLLEVIITLTLISVTFVAILGAVAAMIAGGAQNRNASTAETTARNLGEFVKTQPYVPCSSDPETVYQAAADAAPEGTFAEGYSTTVDEVLTWNGESPALFVPCGADGGVQRVTVTVQSPADGLGGQFARTLTVTKRSTS